VWSDILTAVQYAHNQHTIRLRLVENYMAALHEAVQAGGLQLLALAPGMGTRG
jgi:hypothetical protein